MSIEDPNSPAGKQAARRRTFAIISHPDAGKTTLTEKLLLFGGAIQLAGAVKGRKAARHATSDWMKLEQERGISVTTSVMQFVHRDAVVNLLDTPGHADFSEDTYRTLSAVDSALMVIDAAKGVEPRTIKLMEVCRMRDTPIVTFINKLDRDGQDPMTLLSEVEDILKLDCAAITWPIGMGRHFRGVYHMLKDCVLLYDGSRDRAVDAQVIQGLDNPELDQLIPDEIEALREEVELVKEAGTPFDQQRYLKGELTPVYFGSAINNFGVAELLDAFVDWAPAPAPRPADTREVCPSEKPFSGFVFKIQANMDPAHRDRVAFLRVCSGTYQKGMKLHSVRMKKPVRVSDALVFMADRRENVETAWPGDVIGLHNHGTIVIGDSLTEGETLNFPGIPNFAPELFQRVVPADPLRAKAMHKGLDQLCEEGATQVFRPMMGNDVVLGAIGALQFDVVAFRLENEYQVACRYEGIDIQTARWISCDDDAELQKFADKNGTRCAIDHAGAMVYLASSGVNLRLTEERWPKISFHATREH